jgi:hypothetical protein
VTELTKTANGIKIEHILSTTFNFTLKFDGKFKENTKVLFEISPGGITPIVSKPFFPVGNSVDISLTDEEENRLRVSRNHLYKLFLVSENKKVCILSGNIKIK